MVIILSHLLYDYVMLPNDANVNFKVGDIVIFKNTDNYNEHAKVVYVGNIIDGKNIKMRQGTYIRHATPHDLQVISTSNDVYSQFLSVAKKLARKHNLNMKFAKVNVSFDNNKLFFLFSADDRVDFRNLVKDLSEATSKPVHLHQIGPRDHARIIGGIGICGYEQCCNTYLAHRGLPSINVDMIRIQRLESRGPQKLSGNCGKLLCCLDYELELYSQLMENLPQIGDKVVLNLDDKQNIYAVVEDINVLGQMIYVCTEDDSKLWIPAQSINKNV